MLPIEHATSSYSLFTQLATSFSLRANLPTCQLGQPANLANLPTCQVSEWFLQGSLNRDPARTKSTETAQHTKQEAMAQTFHFSLGVTLEAHR